MSEMHAVFWVIGYAHFLILINSKILARLLQIQKLFLFINRFVMATKIFYTEGNTD